MNIKEIISIAKCLRYKFSRSGRIIYNLKVNVQTEYQDAQFAMVFQMNYEPLMLDIKSIY